MLTLDFVLLHRQASTVQASDVIITDTRDSSSGLQVQFYVQGTSGGVVPASALVTAIQVMDIIDDCVNGTWILSSITVHDF